MQRHVWSSKSPCYISLCLLALAPGCSSHQVKDTDDRDTCISLTTTGSAPSYFHSLMTIYIPSRSLRSASERHLVVPSQRGSKSLSRTFSFTVPGWWNDPPPSGTLNPWQPSRNNWKLISSVFTGLLLLLLHKQNKTKQNKTKQNNKNNLCSRCLTSPCPASFCSE